MIIKKLKLENIRSYSSSLVTIPEGSILLSGNIGSGKSSILLAVDFALFGLRQKELSGNGLLRNGEDAGSVELEFEIDDKIIEIKRTLKRIGKNVKQNTGFLSINGNKESLSALELKERILGLLGYPKSLLTKSKNLIFRYTVYTPQEEMKEILIGDQDIRLDTLRKVFGIDRYKRIKENSRILLSNLREQKREIEGKISDLDKKLEEKEGKLKEVEITNLSLGKIIPEVEKIKNKLYEKKKEIEGLENKIMVLNDLKKEFSINQRVIESKSEIIKNKEEELKAISRFIVENKDVEVHSPEPLKKLMIEAEERVKKLEKEILELNLLGKEEDIRKRGSENLIRKINELNICPVCKQNVTEDHKHSITNIETTTISSAISKIKELASKEVSLKEQLGTLKKELDRLREEEGSIQLNLFKKTRLREKKDSKEKIEKESARLKEEISSLNKENKELRENIKELESIDYTLIKEEFEKLRAQEKKLEIEKAGYERDMINIKMVIEKLNEEVEEKLKAREKLFTLNRFIFFIDAHFSELMDLMERKVMLKVHTDFETFFQKWFSILVDDEVLNIRLDESFTPLIEQQGHDIDYAYLSGGERTAAALAYRLALNQTINNIVTEIKTKDIIILDEPTDGFSMEQLDRMKQVIEDLDAKQVILVSHDPKIESFVNNVIRIEKQLGSSRAI